MDKFKKLPREQAADGLPADPVDGLPGTVDVEGHSQDDEGGIPGPEQLGTRLPGTGGDYRRPSGGGELTDDTEGHQVI
jgi:hypothetical protein